MATITGKRFQMTDGAATPINLFPYTVSEAVYGLNNSISNAISSALSTISLSTYAGSSAIGSSVQPVYYNGSALVATDLSTTYAPYNAAGYLPLSGGTMSNTNLVANLNADLLHGFHLITSESVDYNIITWNTILFSVTNNAANRPLDDHTYGIRLKQEGEPNVYFTDLATGLWTDALYYRRHDYINGYNNWHQIAFTDSNVASATKLQTPRLIWGQSFDGTGDVDGNLTINDGAAGVQLGHDSTTEYLLLDSGQSGTIGNGADYAAFQINKSTLETSIFYPGTLSFIRLSNYPNPSFIIDNNGNVGIGTTEPACTLDVNGYGRAQYLLFWNTDKTGNAGYVGRGGVSTNNIQLTASSGNACGIGANGMDDVIFVNTYLNVGIGTTSPTQKLHVVGNILSTGDQIINSDLTLKTNLKDVTYSVSDIAKCRAVTFDWKDGHGHSAGSIAQDWKPLIPELVHGEEGGMTLAYGQIALVNSILEAREIERLKERVAELEQQLKMRS